MDTITSPSQESLSDTYKFPVESSSSNTNSVYSLSSIESSVSRKGNKRRSSIFHFTPSQRFIAAAKTADFHTLMEYRSQMDRYSLYKALMAVVRLEIVLDQHLPIVTSLLTGPIRASPNDKDQIAERTPLIWAIIRKNVGLVEVILQNGALVEEIDGKEKLTPLMWAAYQRADRIAEILVNHGASYTTTDENFRRTPLLWAAESGSDRICRLLLEIDGTLINARDKNGMTPLALAYLGNHIDAAGIFVRYGDDCNYMFSDGHTLLIRAIDKANDAKFVKLLVENGADVLVRSPEYVPPLTLAIHGRDSAIIQTLLAHKPDLEAADKKGRTALMYAILSNDFHLVELLLAHGAKKSCKDIKGVTMRRAAEKAPDRRILALILQERADNWVLKAELPG